MLDSLELAHLLVVWDIGLGSEPSSNDEESRHRSTPICCLHGPFTSILAEFGRGHNRFDAVSLLRLQTLSTRLKYTCSSRQSG